MMQPDNQPGNQYFQPQAPQQPVSVPPQPGQQTPPAQQAPPTGANDAHKSNTPYIIGLVVLSILLIASLIFGFWAFAQMTDYKNNVDAKIAVAVADAEKATTAINTAAFADEQMKDTKKYIGPSSYGTITVDYPKIWSGYVAIDDNSNDPLKAVFHPDVVPALTGNNKTQAIALQVEVVNDEYDKVVDKSQRYVEDGSATAAAYALPLMPDQVGIKITGKINQNFVGTQVILPLRDKTIIITAETDQFANDLETYILPKMSFVP